MKHVTQTTIKLEDDLCYGLGLELFFVLSETRAGAGAFADMCRPYTLKTKQKN